MGDPNVLDNTLQNNDLPVAKKPTPVLTAPDPNETTTVAPAPGKATRKPIAVTAPFLPKPVDRVKQVKVGSSVYKTVPAETQDVPAQMSNDGKVELRPAATVVVKPETEVLVEKGADGFLNGGGGIRERAQNSGYKHEYMKPIKFMGSKKKAVK